MTEIIIVKQLELLMFYNIERQRKGCYLTHRRQRSKWPTFPRQYPGGSQECTINCQVNVFLLVDPKSSPSLLKAGPLRTSLRSCCTRSLFSLSTVWLAFLLCDRETCRSPCLAGHHCPSPPEPLTLEDSWVGQARPHSVDLVLVPDSRP